MSKLTITFPYLIANKDIKKVSENLFLHLKTKVDFNYNKVINKLSKWLNKKTF